MKAILTILVSAVITWDCALSFLVFRGDRQMPQMLKDLGNVSGRNHGSFGGILPEGCHDRVADTGLWQVIAAVATGICYKCAVITPLSASCWEPRAIDLLRSANLNTWTNYDERMKKM